MNYIVYKTTNLINGKIYVGVHRTNPDIFDGYIGCGVSKKDQKKKIKGFPKAVQKYGYENFKREILFIFPDTEEGKDLADIFFEFHLKSVNITDEECKRYAISREIADKIVNAIRTFANEMYNQKLNGTLLDTKKDFPTDAMKYNRNK